MSVASGATRSGSGTRASPLPGRGVEQAEPVHSPNTTSDPGAAPSGPAGASGPHGSATAAPPFGGAAETGCARASDSRNNGGMSIVIEIAMRFMLQASVARGTRSTLASASVDNLLSCGDCSFRPMTGRFRNSPAQPVDWSSGLCLHGPTSRATPCLFVTALFEPELDSVDRQCMRSRESSAGPDPRDRVR